MNVGHLEGEHPYLGDSLIMVFNHVLTGMILQVVRITSTFWKGPPSNPIVRGLTTITMVINHVSVRPGMILQGPRGIVLQSLQNWRDMV